jgi:hypothetical protein
MNLGLENSSDTWEAQAEMGDKVFHIERETLFAGKSANCSSKTRYQWDCYLHAPVHSIEMHDT